MRGGVIHERSLDLLDTRFASLGAKTGRQVPVSLGRSTGYIDLVVEMESILLAIEAERSERRVAGDVIKAQKVGAAELWIVTPQQMLARRIRDSLVDVCPGKQNHLAVSVLTLGDALHQVPDCFSRFLSS